MADFGQQAVVGDREATKKPLFRDIDAQLDLDELEMSEIESLCMRCHENGTTRLLLTKIPMFREVIVSSFHCPHCGESNSEIQPGAPIQDKGVCFTLTVKDTKCLNRMVVKAESASVRIPELEFEIPAQKGQVTTVESVIQQAVTNLELDQPYRTATQPEVGEQIETFLVKLRDCLEVKKPFTVVLNDPVGSSFLQGEFGEEDTALTVEHYQRSKEQDEALMPDISTADTHENGGGGGGGEGEDVTSGAVAADEVMTFSCNCSNCQSPVETRMKLVDVPHFKQVVIMATNCDYCGHRSNEVKSGTGISEFGTKITLKLTDITDLSRDIIKAGTAMLLIPELDFEVQSGTLGGCFTTVEGLLVQARDQLKNSHPFFAGDSATDGGKSKLMAFIDEMDKVIHGERLGVHVILDDPAGNSYIQNTYAPDADPNMTMENYERDFDQNETLGLNDMKTENYTSETKK